MSPSIELKKHNSTGEEHAFKMDAVSDRNGMFVCSATFADILIIGEQLRVCMHAEKNNLVKDQRYHFRWYSSCFAGVETISWLVRTQRAAERFIGVALMNILLEHNIIHNVTASGSFKDDSHLYRFRKDDGSYDFSEETSVFLRGHRLCKRLWSDTQGRKIVRTHVLNQQVHNHCVQVCELIDWMVQRHEAPSREDAVTELRTLFDSGILRHVTSTHELRDDSSLYQFRSDFGRDRILLDLILPPPQPEFGGAIIEDMSAAAPTKPTYLSENNNSEKSQQRSLGKEDAMSVSSAKVNITTKDMPDGNLAKVSAERTESGYHSDHLDASPHSSLSESPMFEMEDDRKTDRLLPFSGGVLIRKATISELQDSNSPYIKKFIRIVSDPVGYGFVIRGDGPVYIKTVDPTSPAAAAGLKVGHYIYSVNDHKVLDVNHRDLAHVILDSNGYITLVVMEHVRDSR